MDSENSGQEVWVSKGLLGSQFIRAQKVIESGISWQNKDLLLSLWESDISSPNDSENGLQCVELTSSGQGVLGIWAQRGNCVVHRYCTGTLH